MLGAAQYFSKLQRSAQREGGSSSLGRRSSDERSTTSRSDLAGDLARSIREVRGWSSRRECLRHNRSRLSSRRRCRDELGERTIHRRGSRMGARKIARARGNHRRRYLRRLFGTEVRALETEVRLELGPSEARAAKCRRNSKNKFCYARTIVAGVSSLRRARLRR